MCTVTYIPIEKGFILTHNRDENINRKISILPKQYMQGELELIYPKDQEKNGTWFCVDKTGRATCVLNGAFSKHTSAPPYNKSRGLVVLETFEAKSFSEWIINVNLDQIEPFTLILVDQDFQELRWDGINKHVKKLAKEESHIWSSATLYNQNTQRKRRIWLNEWLDNHPKTNESMLDFHNTAGEGIAETNLRMSYGTNHKTISITQFSATSINYKMNHFNFLSNRESSLEWK